MELLPHLRSHDFGDFLVDEQDHAGTPVVIHRHGRVVAQHLRARANQRCAVPEAGIFPIENGKHSLAIEMTAKSEAGNEIWHTVLGLSPPPIEGGGRSTPVRTARSSRYYPG